MDDHDYGPQNNADRTTVEPWTWQLWNRIHADPAPLGYFDFRMGDAHCLTLDGRRYADPVTSPNTPSKTKLGVRQLAWMQQILETSDAALFVVFSADIFASRYNPRDHMPSNDCFVTGWPDEYRRLMTLFMDVQLDGRRVVVLSGDAHGLRIHYHPDPRARPHARSLSIVEFICSGLRPGLWTASEPGRPHARPAAPRDRGARRRDDRHRATGLAEPVTHHAGNPGRPGPASRRLPAVAARLRAGRRPPRGGRVTA